MKPVSAWFERKFDFSFPLDLLPNLYARLRGTPARLEEALRAFPTEFLTNKPDGKYSAQEHAGHLLDLESLWLARIEDYAAARGQLTPADLTNRKTAEANHNQTDPELLLAAFRAARESLFRRTQKLDPEAFHRPLPHPRLKTPMYLADHLHFVAEHDDHHLAHIWHLLTAGRPVTRYTP